MNLISFDLKALGMEWAAFCGWEWGRGALVN